MAANPFQAFACTQPASQRPPSAQRASPPAHSRRGRQGSSSAPPPPSPPTTSSSLPSAQPATPAKPAHAEPAPKRRRRGSPHPRDSSKGASPSTRSDHSTLGQCQAREQELRSRLGEGLGEKLSSSPLRLIIIGHNPSEATWAAKHVYAHKSNHMWRLLIQTGIAPPGTTGPEADDTMPTTVGVGFTDVGTGHPGTKSSDFSSEVFMHWREDFYQRMRNHIRTASQSIGCTCGRCGAPALVAFSGKRHYMELLNAGRRGKDKVRSVEIGAQPPHHIPPDWPFPASTEVWVCCSTSGASPMTAAERLAPYQALANRLAAVPWPRIDALPRCIVDGSEGSQAVQSLNYFK